MIKRVIIKHFQSHQHTDLELTPGVNVIAGATNQGKSAIYRAVHWCINNLLRGTGFRPTNYNLRRDTYSECGVWFDVGGIRRKRNNDDNSYVICDDAATTIQTLHAVGTGQPAEVKAITKMDDINFAGQEDGRFLLGRDTTPGDVARMLNQYVGLEIIDKVLDTAKHNVRELDNLLSNRRTELESVGQELGELTYIDEAQKDFDEVDGLYSQYTQLETDVQTVERLDSLANDLDTNIQIKNEWLQVEAHVQAIEAKQAEWETLKNDVDSVKTLCNYAEDLLKDIEANNILIDTYRDELDVLFQEITVCPIFNVACPLPTESRHEPSTD